MKKFLSYLFLTGVISCVTADLAAFDTVNRWFREKYDRFVLGDAIYNGISTQCGKFENNPQGRRKLVNSVYQTPWWVQKMNMLSPQESLFFYAQGIYRDMVQIMEEVKTNLDAIERNTFEQNLGIAWRALDQKLNLVIGESESRVEVDEPQIQKNITAAIDSLWGFETTLRAQTETTAKPNFQGKPNPMFTEPSQTGAEQAAMKKLSIKNNQNIMRVLDNAIKRLDVLRTKKRLTKLERWHRDALIERAAQYVYTRCPLQ